MLKFWKSGNIDKNERVRKKLDFFKLVKGNSRMQKDAQKCEKCGKRATRLATFKNGREIHLCSNCWFASQLTLMVENKIIDGLMLNEAFQKYNNARSAKDHVRATFLFENMIEKIETLIVDYYQKMFSCSDSKKAASYLSLINDFLDVYTEMQMFAARSSFVANKLLLADLFHIVIIEHLIKAIQNRLNFRYFSPSITERFEKSATRSGALKDLPLLEIKRPLKTLLISGIKPLVNFDAIASKFGDEEKLSLMNTYVRYERDICWFAEAYNLLGQSLLKIGFLGAGRIIFYGTNQEEAKRRQILLERLLPNIFCHAEEVYRLALWCSEQLPLSEETYHLKVGYGTGLFDLGISIFAQRRFQEALTCFEKALKVYKGEEKECPAPLNVDIGKADCYLYMAECYAEIGQKEKARNNANIALELARKSFISDNVIKAKRLLARLNSS